MKRKIKGESFVDVLFSQCFRNRLKTIIGIMFRIRCIGKGGTVLKKKKKTSSDS